MADAELIRVLFEEVTEAYRSSEGFIIDDRCTSGEAEQAYREMDTRIAEWDRRLESLLGAGANDSAIAQCVKISAVTRGVTIG